LAPEMQHPEQKQIDMLIAQLSGTARADTTPRNAVRERDESRPLPRFTGGGVQPRIRCRHSCGCYHRGEATVVHKPIAQNYVEQHEMTKTIHLYCSPACVMYSPMHSSNASAAAAAAPSRADRFVMDAAAAHTNRAAEHQADVDFWDSFTLKQLRYWGRDFDGVAEMAADVRVSKDDLIDLYIELEVPKPASMREMEEHVREFRSRFAPTPPPAAAAANATSRHAAPYRLINTAPPQHAPHVHDKLADNMDDRMSRAQQVLEHDKKRHAAAAASYFSTNAPAKKQKQDDDARFSAPPPFGQQQQQQQQQQQMMMPFGAMPPIPMSPYAAAMFFEYQAQQQQQQRQQQAAPGYGFGAASSMYPAYSPYTPPAAAAGYTGYTPYAPPPPAAAAAAAAAGPPPRSAGSDSASDNPILCIVCRNKERDVIFPCSHFVCCRGCAEKIRSTSRICPVCRERFGHKTMLTDVRM
jgi:hypothetical protein